MLEIFETAGFLIGNTAPPAGGGPIQMFGMIIIFMVFMYLLVIRPQKVKDKKHQEAVSKLKKGDEVLLEGGMYGEIFSVEKETVMVKIADKVVVKVHQRGVRLILTGEAADKDANKDSK